MKFVIPATILAATLTIAASAQTFYQPPRYQYGQYNEIFYGGLNPTFTANNYAYLPESLQPAYISRRQNTPIYPYSSPYTPYGPGTRFVSPYFQSGSIQYQSNMNPQIFSDLFPYEEVGQFGYTIDNARNEAYSHVPLIQTGPARVVIPPPVATAATPEATKPADPRLKAIPLLNWAKAEHTRNPALYKALIQEAAKYDPAATAALEKSLETKK